MQKINWLAVGAISVIVLLLLFGGGMTLAPGASAGMAGGWGYRGWSMMEPGGMMNNWGYYSTPTPFGWIGMIFRWLIPVGLVVLAIFGAVWFMRHAVNSKPPSS
jgi:hypothetical protein